MTNEEIEFEIDNDPGLYFWLYDWVKRNAKRLKRLKANGSEIFIKENKTFIEEYLRTR